MSKVLYKPVSILVSVLGGVLAGAVFKRVWKVAFNEDDAPKATDADRGWRSMMESSPAISPGPRMAKIRCSPRCEIMTTFRRPRSSR